MKKVNFIFGVHNHQPVGNFGQVFEALYHQSYEPFLHILHRHPKVKCTFHVTGPLLEWLEANRPAYFKMLKEMAQRGQVEFFTGGMYEPILSILPDRDKLGQIRMLTDYLKEHFQVEPQGMWTAERVWEPHLTKSLAEAGVKYIVMDDAHFKAAGLREDQTFGYYLMEEQGLTAGVFPISEKMRYLVPFRAVEETLDYLRSVATEEGDRAVVLMDDGEKFGGWPDTYKWVYEEGWLERFFNALEQNGDWIHVTTFAEYAKAHAPLGNLNLPTGSYSEMGEWSLPADAAEEFEHIRHEVRDRGEMPRFDRYLKGGFWRNFLAKYDESNQMHKKLLWVSAKVEAARERLGKKATPKQKAVLAQATQALYRGECNCPYWHGVFGGLYLNHLRFAVYREFIEAEKAAESLLPPPPFGLRVLETDFNKDGKDEIVLESDGYHAVLEPGTGGVLTELDYLPKPINLSDTLTRRKEAYHGKLLTAANQAQAQGGVASIHDMVRMKEPDLDKKLFYDQARRASLTEHFTAPGTGVEALLTQRFEEWGDFRKSPFLSKVQAPKKKGQPARVDLSRDGRVMGESLGLEKRLAFKPGDFDLKAQYRLENKGGRLLEFRFFIEWNLTLLAGDAPDRNYFVEGHTLADSRMVSVGEEKNVTAMGLRDGWLELEALFKTEKPALFFRYPVETISQSEGGFEKVYQGSCLLLGWDVQLAPGQSFETTVTTQLKGWRP
ncbi:MAG TPA: alpha-amylase/4-alpha-glucanotransferase domain-containing protein [bacterium]|nr:alpha-amylase/4-alpha-glucanotransferase domain-containing protein [bacterium]